MASGAKSWHRHVLNRAHAGTHARAKTRGAPAGAELSVGNPSRRPRQCHRMTKSYSHDSSRTAWISWSSEAFAAFFMGCLLLHSIWTSVAHLMSEPYIGSKLPS